MKEVNLLCVFLCCLKSVYLQCCLKINGDQCLECPQGFHLYRNNCIKDLNKCSKYLNGFQCIQCQQGYILANDTSSSCILQEIDNGTLPTTGFSQLALSQMNTPLILQLSQIVQRQFAEQVGSIQILKIYVRQSIQILYRLIFITERGVLQTLLSVRNGQLTDIQIEASKIINKATNQQFATNLQQTILANLINDFNIRLNSKGEKYEFIDAYKSSTKKQNTSTILLIYRLIYINANIGIIEINTTVETNEPIVQKIQVEIDINFLTKRLRVAISLIKQSEFIQSSSNLVSLTQITKSVNNNQSISYNATFYEAQIRCNWVQFTITQIQSQNQDTNITINVQLSGRCTVQILPVLPSCRKQIVIIPNIPFIKQLDFDDFLISQAFSQIRQYILQCEQFLFELQSLAIGQTSTTKFYQIKFQLFNAKQQLLFIVASKNIGQSIKIGESYRVLNKDINNINLIGLSEQQQLQQISKFDQLGEVSEFITKQYPQIDSANLTEIKFFNILADKPTKYYCFIYTFPYDVPFQQRQSIEIRISKQITNLVSLPTIFTPVQNYEQIPLQNLDMFGFGVLIDIAKNRIAQQKKIQANQIQIQKLLKSALRTQIFIMYFRLSLVTNIYIFDSFTGQLELVDTYIGPQLDITAQRLLQLEQYSPIIDILLLIFIQIQQYSLEIQGAINMTQNDQIINETKLIVFNKDNIYLNITVIKQTNSTNFTITNVSKNTIFPPQTQFSQINANDFILMYPQLYKKYEKLHKIDDLKQQNTILKVYNSSTEIKIINNESIETILSLQTKTVNFKTLYTIVKNKPQNEFEQFIDFKLDEILIRYKLPSIATKSLIFCQKLGNSTNLHKYTYRLNLTDLSTYELTYEMDKYQKQLKILSIRNIKLASAQRPLQKYTLSDEEVQYIQKLCNQTYKIIKTQIYSKLVKVILKFQHGQLEQLYFVKTDNPQRVFNFMGKISLNNGYEIIGENYARFLGQNRNFALSSLQLNSYFGQIYNFSTQNQQQLSSIMNHKVYITQKQLILWKIKRISKRTTLIQLYFEISNISSVVKFSFYVKSNMFSQQDIKLIAFQTIPNNLQQIDKQQMLLIDQQTHQLQNDSLFQKININLLKKYWYYLQDAELLSAFKMKYQGSLYFVFMFDTSISTVQISVQYSFQQQQSYVLSFTPALYDSQQHSQIYRCFRYSSYDDSCASCHFGYILGKSGKCYAQIDSCWVQSGDQCIYEQPK